jgi:hypothetical protein
MAYATVTDVQNRYHEDLDETLTLIVNTRLADAELLLRNRIPDLDDQILAGTILEDIVVMIEAEMVLRLIRNPEGYSQESDGNYSYAIYQQVASGRLEVLDDEWKLLGVTASVGVIQPNLTSGGTYPADPSLAWGINFPYWYPIGGDPNGVLLPGYPLGT